MRASSFVFAGHTVAMVASVLLGACLVLLSWPLALSKTSVDAQAQDVGAISVVGTLA
ncbi:MAG: hypothetical protein Q8O29_15430 [Polaromonas sp.]|uniref:hypothetical protein n=1 Tax=Polaromonas sp. TaxID=1869339 RepID=UPI0027354763|nr:hypothetical protein [Polaromonas sp.]MDP2819627.1 hypothetical protein [Polaromonas sp.]